MSDSRLDALAETARNRGLKLVRSRIRTPGKRGFGKVGLTDSAGKAVVGVDASGPTATTDEVDAYLRKLEARDWGASLDIAAPQRKRMGKTPAGASPTASNDRPEKPKPAPRPKPPPRPLIRQARAADAPRLAKLIVELGHPIDETQVRKNLSAVARAGDVTFVATLGTQITGMCGVNKRVVIHRPAPLGRIIALVVTDQAQGKGIGRLLVETAEQWCRKAGCHLLEVTSNDRRSEAHAFYRHMGYERSSIRFFKTL